MRNEQKGISMNLSKSIWRRLLSCLFALALLVVSFPMSAFALENGVRLRPENYLVDDSGNFTDQIKTLVGLQYDHPETSTRWFLEDDTVDLWVYSDAMTEANEADGSVAPYAFDEDGNKYELKTVAIKNARAATDGDTIVMMNSSDIERATSKAAYQMSTADLTMTPYGSGSSSYYFVAFGWSLVQETTNQKYQVSYDLNFPENATTLFAVWDNGGLDAAESNGVLPDVQNELKNLDGPAYSNQPYTVSDFPDNKPYGDFIAFTYDSDYGHDYFDFDGWTVKGKDESIVYKIGQSIPGDQLASLADDNGNITFVAKWSSIKNWTNTELEEAANSLTLNAVRGVDTQTPLITQSVNGAAATGNSVTLKEGDTISYTVQTQLGGNLGGSSDSDNMTTLDNFATFTYQVKVDEDLEFVDADQDGQVTLTLDADNLMLTVSNIPGAVISEDKKTITFAPNSVPKADDGRMDISVTMEWRSGTKLSDSYKPIILRGLDFEIKDSAVDSYGVVPEIKTYANVTGSINLHNKASAWRSYYQSIYNLLNYPTWYEYFGLNADWHNYPAAVAHASQFIDYKLKNFDLSTDPTATLEDNTVVANSEDEKTSYPALDKKVQGEGDTEWDTDITAAANETVSFQLNSNVPQDLLNYITYPDAQDPSVVTSQIATLSEKNSGTYELVFHDQMDEAFTNLGDLQVILDRAGDDHDVTLTSDSGQYTYTTETGDGCTFHIVIDLAELYASNVINNDDIQNVTPITVTYTATLASDVAAGKYLNTAWVAYPGDEGVSEESTVSVTTYGINIFKYDQAKGVDGADAGLAGAEFMIYGSGAVVNDKLTEGAEPIRDEAVVSGEDGHVIIDGLDAGTYYLVETKAPQNYVQSDKPLKVTIPEDIDETTYRAAVNFANSLVPHTGGTGTVMYTVGGLAIIVLAGILLVVYRKSRKKQDR